MGIRVLPSGDRFFQGKNKNREGGGGTFFFFCQTVSWFSHLQASRRWAVSVIFSSFREKETEKKNMLVQSASTVASCRTEKYGIWQ